jgi:glycosyltransferase involved in cell wall biosynthesis
LLLNKGFNPYGGIARSFIYLAKGTLTQPVRFHFGSFEPCINEVEAELLQGHHRAVVFCPKKVGGIDVVIQLKKYIQENNICLVFACCFRSYFLAKLASGFSQRVVFWGHSLRTLVITTPPKTLKTLIFYILLNNGWLVCNSSYSLYSYVRKGRERIKVIHNGVKQIIAMPKEEAKKSLGLPKGAKVLTYVAEYRPWKDHQTLLLAFQSLAENNRDIYLILCGRLGSLKDDLIEKIIGKDDLRQRVICLGPRKDIPQILSATDVYVHPCYMEGFGNIVTEAMSANIPVVVANSGALPEVVGGAGFLFHPRDPVSLEKAVLTLLNNGTKRKRLAQKGRIRYFEHFSTDAFAQRFLITVKEILTDLGDI